MASVEDIVKPNHFDKFCEKVILTNRSGQAYGGLTPGHDTLPGNVLSTTITFDGNTGTGGVGDYDASGNPLTLANVTGIVSVKVLGYCSTTLTGTTAGFKVGIDNDDDICLEVASAEDMDAGKFVTRLGEIDYTVNPSTLDDANILADDIKLEVTTANISAGSIKFLIYWEPMSADGNVSV